MQQTDHPPPCLSLASLCVQTLGYHSEQLLDECEDILHMLPATAKAQLLAIFRRKGLVTDGALLALADELWTTLDLAACPAVTEEAFCEVIQRCRLLKAVDVTQCPLLGEAAACCLLAHAPLTDLRCGGCPSSNVLPAVLVSQLLTPFDQSKLPVCDDWEELETAADDLWRAGGCGAALRTLYWPGAAAHVAADLAVARPGMRILGARPASASAAPSPAELFNQKLKRDLFGRDLSPAGAAAAPGSSSARGQRQECADGAASTSPPPALPPLDGDLLRGLDPALLQHHSEASCSGDGDKRALRPLDNGPVLGIAERFRLAYISRAQRLAPKRERNVRQQERRYERSRRSDQRHLDEYLDSFTIHD